MFELKFRASFGLKLKFSGRAELKLKFNGDGSGNSWANDRCDCVCDNIGSDCIRIIAAVAIAAIVFATTAAEVMNSGSGRNGGRRQRRGRH